MWISCARGVHILSQALMEVEVTYHVGGAAPRTDIAAGGTAQWLTGKAIMCKKRSAPCVIETQVWPEEEQPRFGVGIYVGLESELLLEGVSEGNEVVLREPPDFEVDATMHKVLFNGREVWFGPSPATIAAWHLPNNLQKHGGLSLWDAHRCSRRCWTSYRSAPGAAMIGDQRA